MIKKIILSFLLLGSALIAQTKVEYQISFIGMNMDYREYDSSDHILDSEKSDYSDISGVEIGYRFLLKNNTNISFNFVGVNGETQYLGSALNSDQPYGSEVSTTSNTIYDISLGYNAKHMLNSNVMMLGGIGVGYRYWQRELSSIQIEEYTWYSVRVNAGVEFDYKDLSTSLIAEYQYGIKPEMTATGISDDFELSSANIVKISVPIRYALTQNFDLSCAYVFEYQEIKESNVIYDGGTTGYVEPDSKAYNQYIKIEMIFKY